MTDAMTFGDLSPADQQLVRDAQTVYEFFQKKIAPKLSASGEERERFLEAPSRYLVDAGCPGIAGLSDEKQASMNTLLAAPMPDAQNVGCWICTKAIEVVITLVVVIGAVVVAAVIIALATAIAGAAGLMVGIVLTMIAEVGITVGSIILAPYVEALAILVCKKTGAC